MPLVDLLGQWTSLTVASVEPVMLTPLSGNESIETLPLKGDPGKPLMPGDSLDVFVYADPSGRPIATATRPHLVLGEVTFLTVVDNTEVGWFVDMGIDKQLLIPFAEQTRELHLGAREPVGLYIDNSGRLAGTMRVSEMLRQPARAAGTIELDSWLQGEILRTDVAGVFVLVQKSWVALVPNHEVCRLSRGQPGRFRVTHIHPDARVELSLRGHAHEELENDAQQILTVLSQPGAQAASDRDSPEEIRDRFGLSKKAFKRAVGGLLKGGRLELGRDGLLRLPE